MKKINIAIDGPVASGKSTIAKILAEKLGYIHIDTGAMYRCVAYLALKNNVDFQDEQALIKIVKDNTIELTNDGRVLCNHQDVTHEIRSNEVSAAASLVSVFSGVRKKLVKLQQKMALDKGVVMDGRDIGTVVLPDAELKIFQTASAESRANRRYQENIKKGITTDFAQLVDEINRRDYADTHREASPLKKAKDAIELDTSYLSIEEVIQRIEKEIERITEND